MAGEYITFSNGSQPAANDTNLNNMQQLIKQDIQNNAVSVVDDLTSTSTTNALSANQGNILKTLLDGTVLYNNSQGITTGDIILSESMANYKRLVFYSPNGEWIGEMLTDATQGVLQQFDQGSQNTLLRIAKLNITNNTKLTFNTNKTIFYNGTTWATSSVSFVTVGKIIGYNY